MSDLSDEDLDAIEVLAQRADSSDIAPDLARLVPVLVAALRGERENTQALEHEISRLCRLWEKDAALLAGEREKTARLRAALEEQIVTFGPDECRCYYQCICESLHAAARSALAETDLGESR